MRKLTALELETRRLNLNSTGFAGLIGAPCECGCELGNCDRAYTYCNRCLHCICRQCSWPDEEDEAERMANPDKWAPKVTHRVCFACKHGSAIAKAEGGAS